jgi:hypothetical protein
LRDESINHSNLSLKIGYCRMMLSNHGVTRLVRFISKVKVEVVK